MKISNLLNEIEIKKIENNFEKDSLAKNLKKVADASYPKGSPWSEKQFLDTLQTNHSLIFIAHVPKKETAESVSKNNIVGLLVATNTKIEVDVYMVAVCEKYKNNQIGRKLFEALIQFSKNQSIQDIYLEVRKSNIPAIRLYERMHFQKIGSRKNYYSNPTEDALLMKRTL